MQRSMSALQLQQNQQQQLLLQLAGMNPQALAQVGFELVISCTIFTSAKDWVANAVRTLIIVRNSSNIRHHESYKHIKFESASGRT